MARLNGCYHYHVRNQQYHCHDIVFILDDDLSDNHRHVLDNVVTDVNLLGLLVIFVLLLDDLPNDIDLNNLNNKKHPNVPSQYPSSRSPRTSTANDHHDVKVSLHLQYPGAGSAGREPPQLYEFEFIFDHLLYFDHVFSFVEFGYVGYWHHNLKHFSIIVGVIFNIVPRIIKQYHDFELFYLDYTNVKRSQQRTFPHKSTAFPDIWHFVPRFNPF
ncbi:uncharacterized protein BDZ83DRAFT_793284 [Colletotrichum acutatum]|uniref:Uncharacterized protein n=1 Tax=Glomerella acutata TaxID=27357 RepID=A0AAD8XEZ7_GLOAC|nr:uncharacterized protein BDZ83DRAFT_793284 [Colletotrichum acutatum]KAK1723901.1 hypothetical protein BDZ83DRAFT_793284 [Colletotrichum acutatum]